MSQAHQEPALHPAAGMVLGDPDEAALRLTRLTWVWVSYHGMWVGVLATLALGGYPRGRLLAILALTVLSLLLSMSVTVSGRGGRDARQLLGTLRIVSVVKAVLGVALTGGLRSPLAFTMFVNFSTLFSRQGSSGRGQAAFAAFCAVVLGIALAPSALLGPRVADPWFTLATCIATLATLIVHLRFITVLQQSANDAVAQAFRAREELADQALARARDLEQVGSRLSHELKNPLAAIKALVQLSHRSAADAGTRERLAVAEEEVERMSAILESHLTFTRPLDLVRLSSVHLGELADSVLAALRARADTSGVLLRRSGDAHLTVDPHHLREALFNLVANAIEACPGGAEVEVAIEALGSDTRVAVRDTGRGMAPEVLARLGTPYFTTREKGTGLGVVLARAVFEQHGGRLEYVSSPGKGTTAVGTLPSPPPP